MARILIVGCGCRGRELAARLILAGHTVRGTTRAANVLSAIERTGAEGVLADPDRLGTIIETLSGVAIVCWLLGDADDAPALHGDRLATLSERLVDTPVRGLVYEAAGRADPDVLRRGAAIVRRAAETWHIPVEVVGVSPREHDPWGKAMAAAVGRLLAA